MPATRHAQDEHELDGIVDVSRSDREHVCMIPVKSDHQNMRVRYRAAQSRTYPSYYIDQGSDMGICTPMMHLYLYACDAKQRCQEMHGWMKLALENMSSHLLQAALLVKEAHLCVGSSAVAEMPHMVIYVDGILPSHIWITH